MRLADERATWQIHFILCGDGSMRFHDLATDKVLIGTMGVILALLFVRVGVHVTAVRVVVQLAAFSLLVVYGWRARGVMAQGMTKSVEG